MKRLSVGSVAALLCSSGIAFAQMPTEAPEVETEAGDPLAQVDVQMFASYAYIEGDAVDQNEFEVPRAELGARLFPARQYGGELRIEAIRSAGGQSITGIDGDSLVFRLKRAWAFAATDLGPLTIEGRAGLIPDPWIESIESTYDFRGVGPTLGERTGFYDTSDLGVALLVRAFERRLAVTIAAQNGEGRNQIEQNDGKNLSAVVRYRVLEFDAAGTANHVTVIVGGRNGSLGPSAARSHRLSSGLALQSGIYSAGAEYTRAFGVADESGRNADGVGVWFSGYVPGLRTGALARGDYFDQNSSVSDDEQWQFTAGLFADLIPARFDRRVRGYVLGRVDRFGESAAPVVGVPSAADSISFLAVFSIQAGTGVLP